MLDSNVSILIKAFPLKHQHQMIHYDAQMILIMFANSTYIHFITSQVLIYQFIFKFYFLHIISATIITCFIILKVEKKMIIQIKTLTSSCLVVLVSRASCSTDAMSPFLTFITLNCMMPGKNLFTTYNTQFNGSHSEKICKWLFFQTTGLYISIWIAITLLPDIWPAQFTSKSI